ncbi:MAG TPA: carboxypeptidase-like regulatory domain-containing protein [Pyrinomonadaceae bacterium]|nr:carboxypeptidase-like regulatory domain-containing protein [Pyrinomonadaceae bacterium]
MNALQEARLTMSRTVEKLSDDFPAIIALIPALVTAIAELKAHIAEILSLEQAIGTDLKGVTRDKSVLKTELAKLASIVAGAIYAYATVIKNNTLAQEVNTNNSKLLKTRDDLLAPRCQAIHDKALNLRGELADYNIDAEKLSELQTAIDNYQAATPKTRIAVTDRKVLIKQQTAVFKKIDELFTKRIDKLVATLSATHPEFVDKYESDRKVIDPRTISTQLKGTVKDATGNPIKNATITVIELGLTTKSDAQGRYSFKPIQYGKHTVKATSNGLNDVEIEDVDIKVGEIKNLVITMNR